jgi:hypothetical protein
MKRIAETGGLGLLWHQPDFTGLNQVLFGQAGEVVATLRTFDGPRGLEGVAEAAEGRWAFGSKGLFKRYTEIASGGAEVGRFKAHGDNGVLEMPAGRRLYGWARLEQPHLHWSWVDAAGVEALDFQAPPRNDVSSRALSARIDVAAEALPRPELPLLVLLCGFLMIRGDGAPTLELHEMESKLGVKDIYGF